VVLGYRNLCGHYGLGKECIQNCGGERSWKTSSYKNEKEMEGMHYDGFRKIGFNVTKYRTFGFRYRRIRCYKGDVSELQESVTFSGLFFLLKREKVDLRDHCDVCVSVPLSVFEPMKRFL
jgi:hypothetical protein